MGRRIRKGSGGKMPASAVTMEILIKAGLGGGRWGVASKCTGKLAGKRLINCLIFA
jgi:hypothetical protein